MIPYRLFLRLADFGFLDGVFWFVKLYVYFYADFILLTLKF